MSFQRVGFGLVAAVALVACGGDEGSNDGNMPTGTAAAPATQGTGGTTATQTGASTAAGTGATEMPMLMCPADQGITSCGGAACAPVEANLAMICIQTCCTDTGACGQFNAASGEACRDVSGGSGHQCPDEMILGSSVPGCCVDGSNSCGVLDLTGLLGGGCIERSMAAIVAPGITALNCDGTTPPPPETGAAGAGAAGAGAAGAAAGAGG
ncbi:MAG: hypothetical protein OEZ06_03300 [Myxococcales bacterium]|nr:hypothetical protein [Myxococcales bacterium]